MKRHESGFLFLVKYFLRSSVHVYLKGFYVFSCLLPENMQCPIQGNLDMRKQLHFSWQTTDVIQPWQTSCSKNKLQFTAFFFSFDKLVFVLIFVVCVFLVCECSWPIRTTFLLSSKPHELHCTTNQRAQYRKSEALWFNGQTLLIFKETWWEKTKLNEIIIRLYIINLAFY